MEFIESRENKIIKNIKKLKQKKYRDLEKKFIAEGWKFLTYNYVPEIIILRKDIIEDEKIKKLTENFDSRKIIVSEKIFSDLSSQENSQGVMLIYNKKNIDVSRIKNNVVILDGIADPGNLGTIIRICDATNFKDIILTNNSTDVYNEKVVRSSMGSIFNVNLYYFNKEEVFSFLKKNNYTIFSTNLNENSIQYNKIKLGERNAIIFGNEGNGVSDDFIKLSHYEIIIPLLGEAESLNVAVATGIILYKIKEIEGVF